MNSTALFPNGRFEIALPYRIGVNNTKEAIKIINEYNGIKRVFYSLYHIDANPNRVNPILDKIWFDFDSDNSHSNTIKLHEWCKERNIKHCMVFSGGGFHFYIFTDKQQLKSSKNALLKIHRDIMEELNFTSGDNHTCDVDGHIVGDIARIVTLPGTYNLRRKRYAICLTEEELYKSFDEIKELAKIQRYDIYFYNKEPFRLDKYKNIEETHICFDSEFCENTITLDCDNDIQKFPPCIQKILLNIDESGDWKGRWLATTFLHEYGLTDEQITQLAKKYFGDAPRSDNYRNNYNHWKKVKVLNYAKTNVFPKCDLMFRDGKCPGKCRWYK